MLREIIEKIEDTKPKTEDSNSEVAKDEKGVNGNKAVLQKD